MLFSARAVLEHWPLAALCALCAVEVLRAEPGQETLSECVWALLVLREESEKATESLFGFNHSPPFGGDEENSTWHSGDDQAMIICKESRKRGSGDQSFVDMRIDNIEGDSVVVSRTERRNFSTKYLLIRDPSLVRALFFPGRRSLLMPRSRWKYSSFSSSVARYRSRLPST